MAWRDYSETNYGYDAYDEKMGPNAMPLQSTPQYPTNGRAGHHSSNGNGYSNGPPNMSLPRPHHGQPHSQNSMRHNGGGASNGLNHNPDFYFMPSQRKYSGEMVRVYVDHNKR